MALRFALEQVRPVERARERSDKAQPARMVGVAVKVAEIVELHVPEGSRLVEIGDLLDLHRHQNATGAADVTLDFHPGPGEGMGAPHTNHGTGAFHFPVEHIGEDIPAIKAFRVEEDRQAERLKPVADEARRSGITARIAQEYVRHRPLPFLAGEREG